MKSATSRGICCEAAPIQKEKTDREAIPSDTLNKMSQCRIKKKQAAKQLRLERKQESPEGLSLELENF